MNSKSVCELSPEELMEFFALHNAFKAEEKESERAKASWKFLCFVYTRLGEDMLNYFVNDMFDNKGDSKQIIMTLVKAKALLRPVL